MPLSCFGLLSWPNLICGGKGAELLLCWIVLLNPSLTRGPHLIAVILGEEPFQHKETISLVRLQLLLAQKLGLLRALPLLLLLLLLR